MLKVIIETCLLDEEEKIRMCEIVTRAGADYIKTSTGFSTEEPPSRMWSFSAAMWERRPDQSRRRDQFLCGRGEVYRTGRVQAGDQPSGEDCQSGKNPLIFLVMAGQIRRNEEKTV